MNFLKKLSILLLKGVSTLIIIAIVIITFFPGSFTGSFLEEMMNAEYGSRNYGNETSKFVRNSLGTILGEYIFTETKVKIPNKWGKGIDINFLLEFKNKGGESFGYYCASLTFPDVSIRLLLLNELIRNTSYGSSPDIEDIDTFFCLSFPYENIIREPDDFILWATEDKRKTDLKSKINNEYEEKFGANYSILHTIFKEEELEIFRRDNWDISYDGFVFRDYAEHAIVGLETWNINSNGERINIREFKKHYYYSLKNYSWEEKVKKSHVEKQKNSWKDKWNKGVKEGKNWIIKKLE